MTDARGELRILIEEYDPANSDWGFRKGVMLQVLNRAAPVRQCDGEPAYRSQIFQAAERASKRSSQEVSNFWIETFIGEMLVEPRDDDWAGMTTRPIGMDLHATPPARSDAKCTCGQSGHGNAHEPGCPMSGYTGPVKSERQEHATAARCDAGSAGLSADELRRQRDDADGRIAGWRERAEAAESQLSSARKALEVMPEPETMLTYASILGKQQFVVQNNVKYPIPTGEVVDAAIAALNICAALQQIDRPDHGTATTAAVNHGGKA